MVRLRNKTRFRKAIYKQIKVIIHVGWYKIRIGRYVLPLGCNDDSIVGNIAAGGSVCA